jgi:1-acyl-sn-glycerol-3-phosphate acyltransferase
MDSRCPSQTAFQNLSGNTSDNASDNTSDNASDNTVEHSDIKQTGSDAMQFLLEDQARAASPYRFGWFDRFCLWYPPGWLVLFNRHWQHYYADPEGWNWLEYLLFLLPGGFYVALLMRWLRLGCRAPREVDRSIDPVYQQAFRQEILMPILKHYFRAELQQVEHLPPDGNLLVLINHAGMCFPWDMIGLGVLLNEAKGWVVKPVGHPIFFEHPWLQWWLPPGWSQLLGGVRAEETAVETAVAQLSHQSAKSAEGTSIPTVVLYAPEGWRGLVKGWRYRYQLQKFDPSFLRLSDRYRVPLLPVVCMGNEYLHPWTVNLKKAARWLGMPIFPLSPLLLVFLLFPSMGVWANRTRLQYFIQPLQQPWQDPLPAAQALQQRTIAYQKAQQLRLELQKKIDQLRPRKRSNR